MCHFQFQEAIMRALPREGQLVMTRIIFSVFSILLAVSASAADLSDKQRAEIEERIKPVGEVCLEGDNNCGAAAVAVAGGGAARSGEEVYNAACMACHSTGAAGAPKLGDVAGWADRIAKGNDALYSSAINGIAGTGMMAKGGCMNCSDEETTAAVDYMVAGSQ
jgi:cytochrome c5